jgi:hypothetical protein
MIIFLLEKGRKRMNKIMSVASTLLLISALAFGSTTQLSKASGAASVGTNYMRIVFFYDWLTTFPETNTQAPNNYAIRIAKARPQAVVINTHMWDERLLNLVPEVKDLFHNNGIKIYAYVNTQRGDIPLTQVFDEIDHAMLAGADGVMFDNVPGFLSDGENATSYYEQCRDKTKSFGTDKIVYFNTGTANNDEMIMTLCDMLGVEHHWDELFDSKPGSPWIVNYSSLRFVACSMQVDNVTPRGYNVTLETAVRDTINCWTAGHIAWFYSARIEGELDPAVPKKWLPDWFEEYTERITRAMAPTLVGDVDGDGKVDISDIYAIVCAYGSSLGQSNWNPYCDLNHDGKIDVADIYIACQNFGKGCH